MDQRDDKRATFAASVQAGMDALYAAALRLTHHRADAEDLVADAVAKAWVAIDTLDDASRFRPWMYRILRNCFISNLRRKSARPTELPCSDLFTDEGETDLAALLIEEPGDFLAWWAEPELRVHNEILGRDIMSAIDDLPAVFRTTILLVNVDGLTYDEAAEVLGVPPGTVRSRMKRGRTMLQKALWRQAEDAGLRAPSPTDGERT